MAIVNTGAIGKALWPGLNAIFGLAYNEFPAEYAEIFKKYSSGKNFEEDLGMYGLGLAEVKPEGDVVHYGDFAQAFLKRYVHITYALGYIVTREAIEDNQYAELAAQRTRMIAKSMRQTKEIVAANVLNRAFNGSYVGADGLELCSLVHLLGKGGTFANKLTTAADLSEASLEQAAIDIMGFVDDASLKISVMPEKLIIPKELCFEAERILKSMLQVDTANNTINALRSKGVLPGGYAVNHYLSDTDAFFILTNAENGMKHFERRGVEFEQDQDFDSDNVKFKGSERYVFSWTDPRGIYGSAGA